MSTTSTDRRNGVNIGSAIKVPCKAATTANITLSAEQTIDGVSCVDGDRVLVKDQTDGIENGIYEVSTSTWQRAKDWDGQSEVKKGTLVLVHSGTVNGPSFQQVTTADPITIGTTSVSLGLVVNSLAGVSAFMLTLLDDASAAAARSTLGAAGLSDANTFTEDQTINGLTIGAGANGLAGNTAVGEAALSSITTGVNNTAVGANALDANTSADGNTAVGSGALETNVTGTGNVAVGLNALTANTNSNNTAVGSESLDANTTGAENTAVGQNALGANISGNDNTAVGFRALEAQTGNNNNTAVGASALLLNTTGANNTAVGQSALDANTTSSNNTAVGVGSLSVCTGAQNTALGRNAGSTITTGSNNTLLGDSAVPSAVDVSNEITLGNASVATLRCQVALTVLSDARDKKEIEDIPVGLDFINALRPVKFTWARRDGTKEGIKEAGFIAQELDEVQQTFNAEEYMRLVYKSNPEKLEATPANLLPVLVKAIQELSEKNKKLEERIKVIEG